MVTGLATNAIRLCLWWLLVLTTPVAAQDWVALARGVEMGTAESSRQLQRVPEAQRTAAWRLLAALSAIGEQRWQDAQALVGQLEASGDAWGWLLAAYLSDFAEVLGAGDFAQRDPETQGQALVGLGSPATPTAWRDNPSVLEASRLLQWARERRGRKFPQLQGVSNVEHFGAWPSPLPGILGGRPTEPEDPAQRLAWLRSHKGTLLARLSGASSQRIFGRAPTDGRWVLLLSLRAGEDLSRYQKLCERLLELVGDSRLVVLWLLELESEDTGSRWRSQLQSVKLPLFVATTRSARSFSEPGWGHSGVGLLLDPNLELRLLVPPGLPLPLLHAPVRRLLD